MKKRILVCRCLKRKTMIVCIKEYIIKTCNLQKSLKLARIKYCFQRKTPKIKYWVLKFLCLETQMVCFVCSAHQNVFLLVDAVDWESTYKDLMKKAVYNPESNKWIMHLCDSCLSTATLKEFLDQELNELEYDDKFDYCHWDITVRTVGFRPISMSFLNCLSEKTYPSEFSRPEVVWNSYQRKSSI